MICFWFPSWWRSLHDCQKSKINHTSFLIGTFFSVMIFYNIFGTQTSSYMSSLSEHYSRRSYKTYYHAFMADNWSVTLYKISIILSYSLLTIWNSCRSVPILKRSFLRSILIMFYWHVPLNNISDTIEMKITRGLRSRLEFERFKFISEREKKKNYVISKQLLWNS